MKSIGGYLPLQLSEGKEYYPSLLKLNSGRHALEYILRIRKYSKVYLPYFTCEVILEPIKKLGLDYQFYTINKQMEPVMDFEAGPEEALLYTNYFGLTAETCLRLTRQFKNLIIDNSQAFFSSPLPDVDSFYSCRKFFGVPDGAYLHTSSSARLKLKRDISIDRFSHLTKSIDLGIERGYQDFVSNNQILSSSPLLSMSALSGRILSGIDYADCKLKRETNFWYLHKYLKSKNDYVIDESSINGPMIYPFLTSSSKIRQKLIDSRIYVASYWPNVLTWANPKMYEYYLTENLIPLPIDHRYSTLHMKQILNVLNKI